MTTEPQQPAAPTAHVQNDGAVQVPIAGVREVSPGVPGAVTLTGVHGLAPTVQVNGKRAKKGMGQVYKIPMQDGSTGKLKMTSMIPGFPKLDFEGRRVLEIPLPSGAVLWVAFLPLILIVLAFGLVGIVAAISLHYVYVWILKRPTWGNAAKVLVPVGLTVALAYPIILANQAVAEAIFG